MSQQKSLKLILAVILILALVVGCGGSTSTPISQTSAATATPVPLTNTPAPTATSELPVKILFIGSSLTYWNQGLYQHIEQLAGSANPPLVIEADSVVMSYSPLEIIWKNSNASKLIGTGDYDQGVRHSRA